MQRLLCLCQVLALLFSDSGSEEQDYEKFFANFVNSFGKSLKMNRSFCRAVYNMIFSNNLAFKGSNVLFAMCRAICKTDGVIHVACIEVSYKLS